MRNIPLSATLACCVAAYGLATAPTAHAITSSASVVMPGGSCQLSIPTTNTGVRPKATGFRNESTTVSNFVICPIASALSQNNNQYTDIAIVVYSIDGASRLVSCTAVAGMYDNPGFTPVYSSKTEAVDSSDTPLGQAYVWSAADFGGTAGNPITGSIVSSITCNLPPQTAISLVQTVYKYEIGQ